MPVLKIMKSTSLLHYWPTNCPLDCNTFARTSPASFLIPQSPTKRPPICEGFPACTGAGPCATSVLAAPRLTASSPVDELTPVTLPGRGSWDQGRHGQRCAQTLSRLSFPAQVSTAPSHLFPMPYCRMCQPARAGSPPIASICAPGLTALPREPLPRSQWEGLSRLTTTADPGPSLPS